MGIGAAVVLMAVLMQPALYGQSTLMFACLMDKGEMPNVEFVIINPAKQTAETTLTLYGAVGQIIGTATATVPSGGQLTERAEQLFPQAAAGGWVQAKSDVAGLRGFWMTGDAMTVGNAEAESSGTELILPVVTISSEITVVNTGSRSTAIRIRMYNGNGRQVAQPIVRVLPAKGAFKAAATALFTPRDWSSVTHVRISSGTPVSAAAQVRDFNVAPSLSLVNAVNVPAGPYTLAFPYVLQGPIGDGQYSTTLGITSVSSSSQTMTLTFYPADGSMPRAIQRKYPGNGAVRASIRTLFGFGDEFQSGWVRVTAPRGAVGFASNADVAQGGSTLAVGMSPPQSTFILGYIAAVPPWWTGLALVNPNNTAAIADLFAIAPDGSLIGGADDTRTARISIPPNGMISRLLSEFVPKTRSLSSNGGFLFVRSNVPLYSLGLSFTRDRRILSVVPDFDLPAATYQPPRPR